tara:strand:+ start:15341 stop:15463 length:123 start_codon:yes stop_codon:yes gene_type:complete
MLNRNIVDLLERVDPPNELPEYIPYNDSLSTLRVNFHLFS